MRENFNREREEEREGKARHGCEVSSRRDLQSNSSSSEKKTGKTKRRVVNPGRALRIPRAG